MAVTVDSKTQKLNIRFRVTGYSKQFYLSTGLKNSPKNRIIADSRWEEIQRDIALGRFDFTLKSYKFGNYQNTVVPVEKISLDKLWDKFLDFQAQHLEPSTLEGDYKQITKIIVELSNQSIVLTWGDISRECTRISITKAYASRVQILKGTKNNRRRVLPCGEGSKLQSLLVEIQPDSPDPKGLIFRGRTGQRLNLNILDKCWRAHDTNGYRYSGVVTELADQGIVPYLKAYSTRHTFATWAIASGASPEKVAYWIGDNVQTVLRYYCHPDVTKAECPDF